MISVSLLALQVACYAAGYGAAHLLARKPLKVLEDHRDREDKFDEIQDFLAEQVRPVRGGAASSLLLQFSEWLDFSRAEIADEESHEDLVRRFGAWRREHTPDSWPAIS